MLSGLTLNCLSHSIHKLLQTNTHSTIDHQRHLITTQGRVAIADSGLSKKSWVVTSPRPLHWLCHWTGRNHFRTCRSDTSTMTSHRDRALRWYFELWYYCVDRHAPMRTDATDKVSKHFASDTVRVQCLLLKCPRLSNAPPNRRSDSEVSWGRTYHWKHDHCGGYAIACCVWGWLTVVGDSNPSQIPVTYLSNVSLVWSNVTGLQHRLPYFTIRVITEQSERSQCQPQSERCTVKRCWMDGTKRIH